jgi:hypothetical protein
MISILDAYLNMFCFDTSLFVNERFYNENYSQKTLSIIIL